MYTNSLDLSGTPESSPGGKVTTGWYSGLISCSFRFFDFVEVTGVTGLALKIIWYNREPKLAKINDNKILENQ